MAGVHRGVVADADTRSRCARVLEHCTLARAARTIGIDDRTLRRMVDGGAVQRAVLLAVRVGLPELERAHGLATPASAGAGAQAA